VHSTTLQNQKMYQQAIEPVSSIEVIHKKFDMICLVDDDPNSIFLHTFFLNEIGYKGLLKQFNYPLSALTEILELSSEHSILILLDLNMPLCTGWEFIDKIDSGWSAIKRNNVTICVLSSSIHPADLNRAHARPLVQCYSEKPLVAADMSSIVNKLVATF